MEYKEITDRYIAPQAEMVELLIGLGAICIASASEKLEEEDGEW